MENPWLSRRILNYAHQGGALEAPSSTMFALDRALSNGATALELDLQMSSDGALIVCHDPSVDRTSDGSGAIDSLTLAQLKMLDNAYYFVPQKDAIVGEPDEQYCFRGLAPRDGRFGFATLEEVLQRFPSTPLNLDIKTDAASRTDAASVAALLREHGRSDDVIVASFDDDMTARFSAFAPEIGTSLGTKALSSLLYGLRVGETPALDPTHHVAVQMPASYAGTWLVDEQVVEVAHGLGLALHVWTVDEEPDMQRLVDLGVDGIISNRPSVLASVLEANAASYRPDKSN